MGDKTGIEWADATWNPVRGCTKVSAGCDNCYAMTVAHRFSGPGQPYEGLTRLIGGRGQWNGRIMLVEKVLDQPLRWQKPRRIFVNSMSDLFHPIVPDEFIDRVFAVMALCPRHTFQILTKRPGRMRDYCSESSLPSRIISAAYRMDSTAGAWINADVHIGGMELLPFPNVWLGVSVEDQATANERIPLLLDTPARVRWLSCEPLLGPVGLDDLVDDKGPMGEDHASCLECDVHPDDDPWSGACIDWVVVGGESGPGSRPMHPDWARALRDQCQTAGIPFLFKQWGDHAEACDSNIDQARESLFVETDGTDSTRWTIDRHSHSTAHMVRIGKHKAGRTLDGETFDQYPEELGVLVPRH